jgi:glucokinase
LEAYCSATGLVRTVQGLLIAREDRSSLRSLSPEEITSKDVYEAVLQGDIIAKEAFSFTGRLLGQALADFVAFSSPQAIILFGGLTNAGDYIMKPIQKAMDDNVLKIFRGKTQLLVSELKDADAAILGASALAWELKG